MLGITAPTVVLKWMEENKMSTQIQPTPIVTGEKAKEIEELLKMEYSEKDIEKGKQVLKDMFEGKEK